jgi:hypothetical protein
LSAPLVVIDTSVLIAALTTTDEDAESPELFRPQGLVPYGWRSPTNF